MEQEPQKVLKQFAALKQAYLNQIHQIKTQQDLNEQAQKKTLMEQISQLDLSAENIFKELSELQLDFGQTVQGLAERLKTELDQLDQIRQAITIAHQEIAELNDIQIAAEALNILKQKQDNQLRELEQKWQAKLDALEKNMAEQRQKWQQEAEQRVEQAQKEAELLAKQRQKGEENYQYQWQWRRRELEDQFQQNKHALEKELAEQEEQKQADWAEREAFLAAHQDDLNAYQQKIATMDEELQAAKQKAREEGIRQAKEQEEHKAQLLAKEREGQLESLQLRIQSLQQNIEEQRAEIAQLTEQLNAAVQEIQALAKAAVSQ